jgi:hypothetical protein
MEQISVRRELATHPTAGTLEIITHGDSTNISLLKSALKW